MRKYGCLLCLLLFLLSGCSFSAESLLALPRTETNNALLPQQAFSLLSGAAVYEVPDAGDMPGSALDIDLNGDGVAETVSCLMKKGTVPRIRALKSMYIKMDGLRLRQKLRGKAIISTHSISPFLMRPGQQAL